MWHGDWDRLIFRAVLVILLIGVGIGGGCLYVCEHNPYRLRVEKVKP